MKLMYNGEEILGGGGSTLEVYSTEETRIGTWIDGKPLYRKVVEATTSDTANESQNIALLNNAEIIRLSGYIMSRLGDRFDVNTYIGTTKPQYVAAYFSKLGFLYVLHSGDPFSSRPVVIIAEYTKTTDVATVELDASERAVYAAAKAEQYSIPSSAVTASAASAEIEEI